MRDAVYLGMLPLYPAKPPPPPPPNALANPASPAYPNVANYTAMKQARIKSFTCPSAPSTDGKNIIMGMAHFTVGGTTIYTGFWSDDYVGVEAYQYFG